MRQKNRVFSVDLILYPLVGKNVLGPLHSCDLLLKSSREDSKTLPSVLEIRRIGTGHRSGLEDSAQLARWTGERQGQAAGGGDTGGPVVAAVLRALGPRCGRAL